LWSAAREYTLWEEAPAAPSMRLCTVFEPLCVGAR
jgi:hypothetical protein